MERLLALGRVEAESRSVRISAARLHYLEAGSGAPLVLVQGAGGGAANWYRIMGPLAEHFRVLAPDLPGFGLSEPIPLRAPLGRHAAAVLRSWLEAIGVERCHVFGTSLGGLLALRMAVDAPRTVRRLVLLDAAGLGRELPLPLRVAALPLVPRLFVRRPSRAGLAWWFRRYVTSDRSRLDRAEQAALVDYMWRSQSAHDPAWLARAVRLFGGPLRGQCEVLSDEELGAIRAPTLVVWGERDRLFPVRHARRAARRIPHSSLELVPEAGHSANWERPEALLERVLPFLTAAEPSDE